MTIGEMTEAELALARERVKTWPRHERVALTKLTEPEACLILLGVALLDLQPDPWNAVRNGE